MGEASARRRATIHARPSRLRLFVPGLIASTVAVDAVSKWLARGLLPVGATRPVPETTLRFVLVYNSGFVRINGHVIPMPVSLTITIIGIAVVLWMIARTRSAARHYAMALSIMVGGGIANLLDLILRGTVTDFIVLRVLGYRFGIFNLADVAIFFGGLLFLFMRTRDGIREEGWRRALFSFSFSPDALLLPPSMRPAEQLRTPDSSSGTER